MNIVERTNQRSMSTSLSLFENEGSVSSDQLFVSKSAFGCM